MWWAKARLKDAAVRPVRSRCAKAWPALVLPMMLGGCVGAAVLPLLASGPLLAKHRVKAATPTRGGARRGVGGQADEGSQPGSELIMTSLKALPPPTGAQGATDPWQQFFTFALASAAKDAGQRRSVLLIANPPLDKPALRDCPVPSPAVVIDLDPGSSTFDPQELASAPAGVAEGLVRLRAAGIVVLWISRLPASRAADVALALKKARLDPGGTDQLLLVRNAKDRKQLLRNDALTDVCVVAIAGDARRDFDELFNYLRHPDQAFGLDAMLGRGWFLVPPIEASATPAQ